MMKRSFFFPVVTWLALIRADVNELRNETYPIDSSWAIKSNKLSDTFGNKQELYDDFMNKCIAASTDFLCQDDEDYRLKINSEQPIAMRNYTRLGFQTIKAPEQMMKLLQEFWEQNKREQYDEKFYATAYHNMWDASPKMIHIQNETLIGGGETLKNHVWDVAKDLLEEWTGQYLVPCSIWGIRVYSNGSILTPHVDRNPLVSSAIINVAQDVEEPWLLEVWGHDGKPHNISMEPGDMVLYESHSIIHGRP
jgi:prolyl 4-hydroxylase